MYSARAVEHFRNPRHAGDLPDATHVGEARHAPTGARVRLALRVEGGRIAEARFRALGCSGTIAACSVTTELITGRRVEEAAALGPEAIEAALDGLPEDRAHCAPLVVEALRRALAPAVAR
ncbi:MAG TPA: iron-sulfur cluster assembly scaffold protein [Thermodesulfobacteriota bacterium]|nr:iron-sulfur cluster assembly scaffold protein [Thermodesulfobacteriota bacterium]